MGSLHMCMDEHVHVSKPKPWISGYNFIIFFVTLGKLFNIPEFLHFHLLNEHAKNHTTNLVDSCEDKRKMLQKQS